MRRAALFWLAMCLPVAALADDAIPDLKGTWKGDFRTLVYGNNAFHPGDQKATDPPRISEITVTVEVEGQDGNLLWGHARVGDGPGDPFAWAVAADGKTIIGSDLDGYHLMTILSPDRMQRCYTHAGISPSGSIVATCGTIDRVK